MEELNKKDSGLVEDNEKIEKGNEKESFKKLIGLAKEKRSEHEEKKKKERGDSTVREYVDKLVNDFPSELKKEVERDLSDMTKAGLDDEQLKVIMEVTARRIREAYLNKLTELPNKEFIRAHITTQIDEIFEKGEPKIEDFKKICYIFFDLNGLKNTNDIAGHSAGDELLKLGGKSLKDEEVESLAKKQETEIKVAHESGDEFSIAQKGENILIENETNNLIEKTQEILYSMEETKDILNLEDEETLYRFYQIESSSKGNIVYPIDSDEFGEFKKTIPENYQYRTYFSAGAATLYEGVMSMDNNEGNIITEDDAYERILQKMMGAMIDESEKRMYKNKEDDKERFRKSNDPHERMLARIWDAARSDEKETEEELVKVKKTIEDIKALAEVGGTMESVLQLIEDRQQ